MLRRSLFAAACLAALTVLGASCGAKETPKPKQIILYAWSEYVPAAVIDGFVKETGIAVHYETFSSNEEMLSKLLTDAISYDVIQPSEYTVEALLKQNKLLPLDPANVPNLKNIAADMRGFPHDPDLKFCAPYMAGTTGIVVNTDKVKDPIKGYKDVFTEAHKGRIVVVNDAREMVTWAASTLGIGANALNAEALQKVKPVLTDWVKLVKVFDSDSPKTALLNGDVDIGVVWSGEAARLYEHDKKYVFTLPEEGAHLYIDHLCISNRAKNKEGAEKFINYVLRPEVSKLISDKFPYMNPNAEGRKLLTEAQRSNPASYPPAWFGGSAAGVLVGMKEKSPHGETFRDVGKLSTDIDKLITDVKNAN